MITIVAGPRTWTDRAWLWRKLDEQHAREPITMMITGGAKGVDSFADGWALRNGVLRRIFPVSGEEWRLHGKRAGPMRNERMARFAAPGGHLIAVARGTRGTTDMIEQARAVGLRVVLI